MMISLLLATGFIALSTIDVSAVVCARGLVRAGCVAAAPGAAVVVARPVVRLLLLHHGPLFAAGCTDNPATH